MTNTARIMIAAGVTALFLAGICLAGLAVRGGQPGPATTAGAPSVAEPEPPAATSGDDGDVSALLDAAIAAASGKDGDVSALLDTVIATVTGDDQRDDDSGSARDEVGGDDD